MIYIRFGGQKFCSNCTKSSLVLMIGSPPLGKLLKVLWCTRDKCYVLSNCYCDDPDGYVQTVIK